MKPFNRKKQQGITGLGTRTVFNNFYEAPFNSQKLTKYYGIIEVGGKSFVSEYEGRFRSEALTALLEDARLMGGTLTTFSVYQ